MKDKDYCGIFLTVLFLCFFFCSFSFLTRNFSWYEYAEKQRKESFYYKYKPEEVKCEKPCCHLLFNRYCIDCREFRDKKNGW